VEAFVNRLERYLLRNMLAGVGTVLLVMSALVVFVNLVSQVEDLNDTHFGAGQLLFYVVLRLPAFLFRTVPVAVLIGTLLGLGSLAVQRELIAMRAVGLSLWRMSRATVFAAVLIGAGAWVLGDVAGPPAEAMAQQMRNAQRLGGVGARLGNQVWLREGPYFVRVDRLVSPRLLGGVEVMAFGEGGRLQEIVRAPRAVVEPDGWLLFDAEGTRFEGEGATVFRQSQGLWPLRIEPRMVEVLAVKPETLTLAELWRQIQFLEENGLQSELFAALFWSRLITSVSVLPMMLLALPLVLGGLRDSSMVRRIATGVGIGAIYYLINLTVGGGGAVLGLPVVVSAWLPTALLSLVALWRLAQTR
jgi:lipopolysaccharide export system permease protein